MSEAEENWPTIPRLLRNPSLTVSGAHLIDPSSEQHSGSSNTAGYDGLLPSTHLFSPMLVPGLKATPESTLGISLARESDFSSNGSVPAVGRGRVPLRRIALCDLCSYASIIVEVALEAASREPWDFILAPLRGGIVPARLVQILIGAHIPIEAFPFTNHGNPDNWIRYQQALTRILQSRGKDRDLLRFGVVDTARGGQGTEDLVQMLRASSLVVREKLLFVDFCILHGRDRPEGAESRIDAAIEAGSDRLCLWYRRWDVLDLIFEDWNAVMGPSDSRRSGARSQSTGSGGFLLAGNNGTKEIRPSNLPLTLMAMLIEIVSDRVRTDKRLRFVRDVINEGMKS